MTARDLAGSEKNDGYRMMKEKEQEERSMMCCPDECKDGLRGMVAGHEAERCCPWCRSAKVREGVRELGENSYLLAKGHVSILSVLFRALLRMDEGDAGYVCEECGRFWPAEEQWHMDRYAKIYSEHTGMRREIVVNVPEGGPFRQIPLASAFLAPTGLANIFATKTLGRSGSRDALARCTDGSASGERRGGCARFRRIWKKRGKTA